MSALGKNDDTGSAGTARIIEEGSWDHSILGPPSEWPACLKSAVDIMLPSHAQIVMFWGEQYVALYNDAYAPSIGLRHPQAFGRPAKENWSELWDDLKPLLDRVLHGGETVSAKDREFYIERHGHPEKVYFDISYSPIKDEKGKIRGVFCIVSETTGRVRSQHALRESEERLRALFSQSAAGIGQTDLDGRMVLVNQRFCKMLHLSIFRRAVPLRATPHRGGLMQFHSPYSHGFVRCAACAPDCEIADPAFNADAVLDLARRGDERNAI